MHYVVQAYLQNIYTFLLIFNGVYFSNNALLFTILPMWKVFLEKNLWLCSDLALHSLFHETDFCDFKFSATYLWIIYSKRKMSCFICNWISKMNRKIFNPLIFNAPKWSCTLQKSSSKCWKIVKICLTILRNYILRLKFCGWQYYVIHHYRFCGWQC